MFSAKDVTLYIPCYNAGVTIERCLEAVAHQGLIPEKVILFDDGSVPPLEIPEKVMKTFNSAGFNVETERFKINRGLAVARNKALEKCKTPLIASIDSDVVVKPQWLENLLSAMNSQKADGVAGRLDEFYTKTLGDRWRAVHMAQHWGDSPVQNPRFLYGSNCLFKKEALVKAGGYNPALKTNYEDMSISEALYKQGCKLYYEPSAKCLHLRRDTEESILPGFWQWYHAKGMIRGEFGSPEGLIKRIDNVNFGIYRYRTDMDIQAKRGEFLILDLLIPWVFCAMDLQKALQLSNMEIPPFPGNDLDKRLPEKIKALLYRILPAGNSDKLLPWHAKYYEKFEKCLDSYNWTFDARKYFP